MATATVNLWEIYEGLKYNFLYKNDLDSIHILLNLYDLEENITNICPKYICLKDIKKKIKYILRYRKDKNLVLNNISFLIHEDIDRLELCFYLEGYKYGYFNNKWVNILEEKALTFYEVEELYRRKYLFHYDIQQKVIIDIKKAFESELDNLENKDNYIESYVNDFCEKVIKKKIKNLNKYIDKQLKIEFNPEETNIMEEGHRFTEKELDRIYDIIIKGINRNINMIYKNACWFGLNDKVLKRYS